ncbi:UDP-glucose--hexose-1-phosphate uridylyltransferase [Marinifilum fragile]|uniref:UDP-glucose--hexose-1-phosphate uridylyltransferase n=1 Tax=Marinifilum fragile TaxID=570161 RepID=UPI002AA8058B|nr:UDP-glucose--hexose-1-phosphate uridylyltransferase [Marinifilum fragile]
MAKFDYIENPHRRYNPLTGEWILVSPHRSKRPWQGQVEKVIEEKRPEYDPKCYLCPSNERVGGEQNQAYEDVYSFQNDFSALLQDTPVGEFSDGDLFRAESESGICKVICFSPNHSLTVPEMKVENIRKVVDLWCKEYKELGDKEDIGYVQIFENKGSIMGCSNPHPHGQIWASKLIPLETSKESENQRAYYEKHGRTMLSDYLKMELDKKERILVENNSFVALVPFWAVWPFETMIISKRAVSNLLELTDEEKTDLADVYKKLTIMYDNLFEVSFAYSAGLHQAPTDGEKHPEWHLHMHFYPPLLRSASVKKFMVGYEMLGTPQRDITAEGAAKRLRELSKIHYKSRQTL